mmetsp:Transcript_44050/g.142052  ORF Transcript_44050/g.142052 Transcript_44050/m.142052 type:complete len:341 (+) Transcript_44050:576-1598(+)
MRLTCTTSAASSPTRSTSPPSSTWRTRRTSCAAPASSRPCGSPEWPTRTGCRTLLSCPGTLCSRRRNGKRRTRSTWREPAPPLRGTKARAHSARERSRSWSRTLPATSSERPRCFSAPFCSRRSSSGAAMRSRPTRSSSRRCCARPFGRAASASCASRACGCRRCGAGRFSSASTGGSARLPLHSPPLVVASARGSSDGASLRPCGSRQRAGPQLHAIGSTTSGGGSARRGCRPPSEATGIDPRSPLAAGRLCGCKARRVWRRSGVPICATSRRRRRRQSSRRSSPSCRRDCRQRWRRARTPNAPSRLARRQTKAAAAGRRWRATGVAWRGSLARRRLGC